MKKRLLVSILLIALMLIVVALYTINRESPVENNQYESSKIIMGEIVEIINSEEIKLEITKEIGDIHQINVAYNTSEIEYSVAYFAGVIPYGYAVISFRDGQAVVKEATIEKGLEGIYTNLIDVVDENSEVASQDLEIKGNVVELAPMKYCVVTENEDEEIVSYDNYGMSYSEDEVEAGYAAYYTTLDGFFIDNSNWTSSNYLVDTSTQAVLECYEGRWIFPEETALINTGSYACNVQALYNISHWLRVNGYTATTMQQEYHKIWDYTNTYQIQSPEGMEDFLYGASGFEATRDGFVKYLKNHQKYKDGEYTSVSVTTSPTASNEKPTESWIRSKIKNNEPILYCYEVKPSSGGTLGHAVAVIGIMEAEKVSSGKTWPYLMIADGWSAKPTYYNYEYVHLHSYKAASFSIK